MNLETRHFRLLVAVAGSGSISGAARRLGVSQPSVSTQLRRIEDEVGQPLFERSATGVVPTRAGALLVRQARLLLRDLAQLTAVDVPAGEARPVRIGLAGVPVADLAPALGGRPPTRAWDVRGVDVVDAAALIAGRLDVLVLAQHAHAPPPPMDGLVVRDASSTEFQVLVPDSIARPGEPVDLTDLAAEPWVLPADERLRAFVLGECRTAGFEPRAAFVVDDLVAAFRLVAAGRGVTLAPPVTELPRGAVGLAYQDATVVRWTVVHRPDLAVDLADEIVGVTAGLLRAGPVPRLLGDVTGPAADARSRTVRIGSMQGRPDAELPTVLHEDFALMAEHHRGDEPDLLADLERGALDAVLRHEYPVPGREGAARPDEVVVARSEPLMLAMTMVHPLGNRAAVSLEDLDGERLLGRTDRPAGELEPQRLMLRQAGVEPRAVLDWEHEEQLFGMLWATGGVAIVGCAVAEPAVRLVPIVDERAHRRVLLSWRPGAPDEALAPVVARAHGALLRRRSHPTVQDRLRLS